MYLTGAISAIIDHDNLRWIAERVLKTCKPELGAKPQVTRVHEVEGATRVRPRVRAYVSGYVSVLYFSLFSNARAHTPLLIANSGRSCRRSWR